MVEAGSSDSSPAPDAPPAVRRRIFAISWLSYFSYYFTRKNYSVVKKLLGLAPDQLKILDAAYLGAYAIGQFANGFLGDVIGPRRMIGIGMIASAILAVIFGVGDGFAIFAVAFGLNGFAQSTGWPGNGRLMASWFSKSERGVIMGYWATCYQVGGLAGSLLATFILARFGWRWAYIGNALWVAVVAIGVLMIMRDRPSELGYRDPDVGGLDEEERRRLRRQAWPRVLRNPMTWCMGLNYFCMKLTRYALLFWLPYYLADGLGYDPVTAGYMSTSFEAGGVCGVIAAGLLADKVFGRRRVMVAVIMTVLLSVALGSYSTIGGDSLAMNFAAMMIVGACLFGPDSLVSGAISQDLGGPHAAALACGMVNGLGSIGGFLQPFVVVYVSQAYGWDALFYVFQILAAIATLALLPYLFVRSEG